jgi:hypothetical protein
MNREIWEFMAGGRDRVIRAWFQEEKLTPQEQAKMDVSINFLRTLDFGLVSHKLLAGPLRGGTKLYKLRVRCRDRELRPYLCRGPIGERDDYTFLQGAIEIGRGMRPHNAEDRAAANRALLLENHTWRGRYGL